MKAFRWVLLASVIAAVVVSLAFPGTALADKDPPEPDDDGGGIITQIFKIIFPQDSLQAALETVLHNILKNNLRGLAVLCQEVLGPLSLENPPLLAEFEVWDEGDTTGEMTRKTVGNLGKRIAHNGVFEQTWKTSVKVAVVLWPATLAIMAAMASKDSLLKTTWGLTDLKMALGQWVCGVVACALSLRILDMGNRLSNGLVRAIMESTGASLSTIGSNVIWAGFNLLEHMNVDDAGGLTAVILMAVVMAVLALVTLVTLVGQYYARIALLLIVVGIAPVVLVLGILRPARWMQWMWLKAVGLVMLMGPINALLVRAIVALDWQRPILAFFLNVSLASVMLTINGAIIKGIFGAATHALSEVMGTVTGVVRGAATAGLAIGAAALTGGAALGVLPASAGAIGGATGAAAQASGSSGRGGASSPASNSGNAGRNLAAGLGSGAPPPDKPAGGGGGGGGSSSQVFAGDGGGDGGESSSQGDGARPASSSGGGSGGYFDRIRQAWDETGPEGRRSAMGASLRAAGMILGPRSIVGRTMRAAGFGLEAAGGGGDGAMPGFGGSRPTSDTPPFTREERKGYNAAMREFERPRVKTALGAAGLRVGQVERDAMAPVFAAAQHETYANIARQAGFGDRGTTEERMEDFVANRMEQQLSLQGFRDAVVTRPGPIPGPPLSENPAWIDYERGQHIAWQGEGGSMEAFARIHHAIRWHADSVPGGLAAATGFYEAAVASGSVEGAAQAARLYGEQVGVPGEQLSMWLQDLGAA